MRETDGLRAPFAFTSMNAGSSVFHLHGQRRHHARVERNVDSIERIVVGSGRGPCLHRHGHRAAEIPAAVINITRTVQRGFLRSADDSDHAGFVYYRSTGNRLGRPEQFHAVHTGFDHAIFADAAFDNLPDILLDHLTNLRPVQLLWQRR